MFPFCVIIRSGHPRDICTLQEKKSSKKKRKAESAQTTQVKTTMVAEICHAAGLV